jgi:hypothetical protein
VLDLACHSLTPSRHCKGNVALSGGLGSIKPPSKNFVLCCQTIARQGTPMKTTTAGKNLLHTAGGGYK